MKILKYTIPFILLLLMQCYNGKQVDDTLKYFCSANFLNAQTQKEKDFILLSCVNYFLDRQRLNDSKKIK
ncbi:MAG: hypothetical protein H7A25_07635 [Leptospiraceae bacterium]|nr:hypothetical protein [Leptospiraceae bacterium]